MSYVRPDQNHRADEDAVIGRTPEQALLGSFVSSVGSGGDCLVLVGHSGVGKTALLGEATKLAEQAEFAVLPTTGLEFAAADRFAILAGLLRPLLDDLSQLEPPAREALEVALGLRSGPVTRPQQLHAAVLDVLRILGSRRPLLVTVDDAHWLDAGSAEALAYAARRATGNRIGVLATRRIGCGGPFATAGLPEHEVRPLRRGEAHQLLATRYPQMPADVRDRVVREAGGLPLALVELPLSLGSSQRGGQAPLPAVLPVGQRLMHLFGDRVAALSPPARRELLVAALQGSGGGLRRLHRACSDDDPELEGLGEAERTGLVRADETSNSLSFTHPLIRATVVQLASEDERRSAHRSLAAASADDPAATMWHRVQAAAAPDETLARALEQHAITTLRMGDAAGAMEALQRAADLSPSRDARARRQVQAAFIGADVSGDLNGAIELLQSADSLQPEITASLPAAVAAAYVLLNGECEVDTAHRLLAEALRTHAAEGAQDGRVLTDAMHSLLMMSWFGGRDELWMPFMEGMDRFGTYVAEGVDVVHRMFGDPVHQALATVPRLERMLETVAEERDPVTITRVALAGVYTDRLGGCREPLWRVIRDGRQGGAVALAINALVSSCVDDWLTGQWDEAVELADEGLRLCGEYGYRRYSVILGGYIRQLVHVCRGDTRDGAEVAAEMSRWAASRGAGMAMTFSHHLETLRAIVREDYAEAYRHLCKISSPGSLPPYSPHVLWVLFDTVEACVRVGRAEEGRRHVEAMAAAQVERISPRLAMVSAGCAALVALGDDAAVAYETALAVPYGPRWPFDRARIQLSYAEWLHRHHDPSSARIHAHEALTTFESLSALPWIRRARYQLRATGERVVEMASTPSDGTLTERELNVARLAAAGLTNREIGERLFLSHRTIGAILYRVFPRLGITSRAQLTEGLQNLPAAAEPSRDSSWGDIANRPT